LGHAEDNYFRDLHLTHDDTRGTELGFNPDSEEEDSPAYIGETAISHTLQRVEQSLHELGTRGKDTKSSIFSPASSLHTTEDFIADRDLVGKTLFGALYQYQLYPRKSEWDTLLDLFCEDVHPLYPFLHLPCLRGSYDMLVGGLNSINWKIDNPGADSFAQVLICLALGRCTTSVRVETSDGLQTSGWSLYCADVESLGDIFDPFKQNSSLSRLQVLLLMVKLTLCAQYIRRYIAHSIRTLN
jgi:hypothetical protein